MELKNKFSQMSIEDKQNTSGGSWVLATTTLVPVFAHLVSSLVGSFKMLFSSSGEVKNSYSKDSSISQKFDNGSSSSSSSEKSTSKSAMPIYFTY